jgi:energy-coupling factor transport system substrate-specific component
MDSLGLSRGVDARVVAAAGVMLAVVFVMTRSVTFNIGPGGYIHTGDIAIYVAAFLFGPLVGLVSGAAGTSLADVSLGYGNWAPGSFFIHGLQGFVASYIGWRGGLPRLILAVIVGGAIVVVGYFLYMLVFIPLDVLEGEEGKTAIAVAWAAVWPNTFQVALAAVVAVPLVYAVQRAYPPILRWGAGPTWVDESANPPR